MKVDLELVKMVLQRNELDMRVVSQVIEDINAEVAAETDEESAPPIKKQYCILVSDPDGDLEGKDLVGYVLQIPEDDSPHTAEERLVRSAYEFNLTPKGRRLPVKTIAEVCEHVSGRITKEQQVWIKTREPVYVLRTDNAVNRMEKLANYIRANRKEADE